jgi:SSS family solute:Na+ symporter
LNLAFIDWAIVFGILAVMVVGVQLSKSQMKSVVDFLSAGRTAGRYLVSVAQGIAGLGAITVLANFEMNYQAGFAMAWWGLSMGIVVLVIAVSGFVAYRFRQTRCLTMAQFFERRYSRNFRIFAGSISYISGIINFGIFPAVGARFFIYFCGLPQTVDLFGLNISTFALTMIVLLTISLYFVFSGGQIAVIVTDFIQGTFVNFVFVIILIFFFSKFDFNQLYEALQTAPIDASMINPFKTGAARDFNIWYHLIAVFGVIYVVLSWQGTQAYNSSAKSAHEAKMGGVLTGWRGFPQTLLFLFIPICAYTVMHHVDFSSQAGAVNEVLSGIGNEAIQSQLRIPLMMKEFLPVGLMGAFAAVMLSAFISTHDSYLHSWGSIFIQDVLLPIRKKPLTPKRHIRYLRLSIIGVAIFIFFFSLLFRQTEYILLFFAITGAIFAGGSGSVIIGGLYWKRGTTAAAWAAMLTGSSVAVGGIIIHQFIPDFFINGQVFWFVAMVGAIAVYILVSLLGKKRGFDMDNLLRRGEYRIREEYEVIDETPSMCLKMLGMGKEFTRGDKFIYILSYAWTFSWTAIFIIGTIYSLIYGFPDSSWMKFWYFYIFLLLVISVLVTIWFTIGGFKDLKEMIARLKALKRDESDDGRILGS